MADKAIGQLNAATAVQSVDLFVLEQNGEAKKLTGQILENWLVSFADGHGGIQTIAKTSSSGTNPVVDTYTITLSDETEYTFDVTNGVKGDTGAQTYVWIKYNAEYPDADSDMGDSPDDYIGVYVGLSSTAPTHYTDYVWFKWKGETGQTGAASTITSQSVTYQEGQSGTVAPSGSWTPNVPTVTQGNYLWTKTELNFNDGTTVTAYSVTRMGVDGTGSVSSVNNVSPDGNGNVALTGTDIPMSDNQSIQTHVTDAEDDIADLTTSVTNIQRDKRKVLFVGDSYGTQTSNWVDFCAAKLGLSSADYVNASISGTGFIVDSASHIGSSYNGFLDELIATTANRNSFTDVVICGGINDAQYDSYQTFLGDHIRDCITYIKTYFPNARPHIGFIGGALENSSVLSGRTWQRRSVAKFAYISQSVPYYLSGVENAIHQSGFCYSSDGLHPNALGAELIGDAVAQAIKTGNVEIYQPERDILITAGASTGVNTAHSNLYYENDKAVFAVDTDFVGAANGTYGISTGMEFALDAWLFFNKKATVMATVYLNVSGTSSVIPAKVEFYQSKMSIFPVALSGSSWATFTNIGALGLPTGIRVEFPSDWIN